MSVHSSETVFAFAMVPMSVVAMIAVISPATIIRLAGETQGSRSSIAEVVLRFAGSLLLIGAAIIWYGRLIK